MNYQSLLMELERLVEQRDFFRDAGDYAIAESFSIRIAELEQVLEAMEPSDEA